MANSPACSTASSAAASAEFHDTDILSDDSGVDISTQPKNSLIPEILNLCISQNKRNKRKSSEPKRRNDVLRMKRFRWDTDEEMEVPVSESDEYYEGERPSSGDSGYQMELADELSKEKQSKAWIKPRLNKAAETIVKPEAIQSANFTLRQSVIKKRETDSVIPLPLVNNLSTISDQKSAANNLIIPNVSVAKKNPEIGTKDSKNKYEIRVKREYDLEPREQELNEPGMSDISDTSSRSASRPRNYKSMSRQRRIEANARERTRVHTISAAFESLRRAVPAYAHNQKLSKLAILRIASAYIVALACLNDQDYSQEQNKPSLSDCIEQCTKTIQAEGRSRRRTKE